MDYLIVVHTHMWHASWRDSYAAMAGGSLHIHTYRMYLLSSTCRPTTPILLFHFMFYLILLGVITRQIAIMRREHDSQMVIVATN